MSDKEKIKGQGQEVSMSYTWQIH